ncbi:aldehyde dehydrogenase family protein [Streptomyces sp. NBC_00316]|uniref:aldehyde dehydrogenase family protein n=1 Tax=Streptomyces sp. NBC_00316 TaxID=2975710 RepID=UPI002E2A8CA5|nr:aldehyde dehydrogenase family protein [Streptomyces sp. NBC_00316]
MTPVVVHDLAHPDEILPDNRTVAHRDVLATVDRARAASRLWAQSGATRPARRPARRGRTGGAGRERARCPRHARGRRTCDRAISPRASVQAQQPYDPVASVHEPAAGAGLLFTRRAPHGIAGLITPWNFPLSVPARKAAPALAFRPPFGGAKASSHGPHNRTGQPWTSAPGPGRQRSSPLHRYW